MDKYSYQKKYFIPKNYDIIKKNFTSMIKEGFHTSYLELNMICPSN